jgi:hypothetical protein
MPVLAREAQHKFTDRLRSVVGRLDAGMSTASPPAGAATDAVSRVSPGIAYTDADADTGAAAVVHDRLLCP